MPKYTDPADIDVRPFLLSRYPPAECVLMEEVSNAAGHSRSRSADFMVMNLWRSRGLYLTCFELKRSRSDWLKELKDPAKAEDIASYCDHFYLLTTSDTIAKMDEIPAAWGWMAIVKNRLVVLKEAPKLKPKEMDRSFLACLLRRASDKGAWTRNEDIEDRLEEAKQRGRAESKRIIEDAHKNLRELREEVSAFEEAAGIKITRRWDRKPEDVGAALKWYMTGGVRDVKKELARLQTIINSLKASTDAVMAMEGMQEYTPADGAAVVKHLKIHEFTGVQLIGSLAKGETSTHDIDILLPNDIRDQKTTDRLIEALYDSVHAIHIEHTDWGGMYFHGTIFGDVDIFFTTKDFDR